MNITDNQIFKTVLSVFVVSCLSLSADAGTIDYSGPMPGPGGMTGWVGNSVWYGGVSESNVEGSGGSDGMTAELFGAPDGIAGDSITFSPDNFLAHSENADSGAKIVDGQLEFMVVAIDGNVINNFQFEEFGDTTLAGLPGDTSFSSVAAAFFVTIAEVDGSPIAPITITGSMDFTPSDGDYELGVDGGPFTFSTIWEGSVFFDIDQILADEGIDFNNGATKLSVVLDNTLTVVSEVGAEAFIRKKVANGIVITTNIPEPTAALLLVLACLPLATKQRS